MTEEDPFFPWRNVNMSAISMDSLVNASVSTNTEHFASSITRNLRC